MLKALLQTLQDKNFSFFTKSTLLSLMGEKALDASLLEVFKVIKVLKRFYGTDISTNASYESILFKKLQDLSHLVTENFNPPQLDGGEVLKKEEAPEVKLSISQVSLKTISHRRLVSLNSGRTSQLKIKLKQDDTQTSSYVQKIPSA